MSDFSTYVRVNAIVQFLQTLFHPLTLINLLTELFRESEREKKGTWFESVKTCCSTDKVHFIPFVRTHLQLVFNSTPV